MEHSYFMRVTPYKQLSYEDIEEVLSNLHIDKYFICYEEASRPHYHLCLFSPRSVENLRWRVKQAVDGEVYLSGKAIEDKVKAVAYCMKDGNWRQKNMDVNTILMANQVKFKKPKFDDELKKLVDNKEDSIRSIVKSIVELHITYNRKIYRQHIKAIVELIKAKRCENFRENLINYFLEEY